MAFEKKEKIDISIGNVCLRGMSVLEKPSWRDEFCSYLCIEKAGARERKKIKKKIRWSLSISQPQVEGRN